MAGSQLKGLQRGDLEKVFVPISSLLSWLTIGGGILCSLQILGVNISPLLAVGGISGIAVGFGAQVLPIPAPTLSQTMQVNMHLGETKQDNSYVIQTLQDNMQFSQSSDIEDGSRDQLAPILANNKLCWRWHTPNVGLSMRWVGECSPRGGCLLLHGTDSAESSKTSDLVYCISAGHRMSSDVNYSSCPTNNV